MGKFKILIILVLMLVFCVENVNASELKSINDNNIKYFQLLDINIDNSDCGSGLAKVANLLNDYILIRLRYVVPILFLLLTSFDFAKSVFADDKAGIGKAKTNLIKRIVVSIIVFFVPMIVDSLMNLFNISC